MIDPHWLQLNYPGLEIEAVPNTLVRIWNPNRPEQEMQLRAGQAKVLWPHCQQTFAAGQAEDSSSWDDQSQPWPVQWTTWRDGWLRALTHASDWHVRPGKDPAPSLLEDAWRALRTAWQVYPPSRATP